KKRAWSDMLGVSGIEYCEVRRHTVVSISHRSPLLPIYPMPDITDIPDTPDSRFLRGIELFNRGEFFEAHEVWEDLWHECASADRKFYQALIQAAVAAYHWSRGNAAGAKRLYHSGRKYMEPFRPTYRGLSVENFWTAMAAHLAGALDSANVAGAPAPIIVLETERRS